jgi:hypothetical protein
MPQLAPAEPALLGRRYDLSRVAVEQLDLLAVYLRKTRKQILTDLIEGCYKQHSAAIERRLTTLR